MKISVKIYANGLGQFDSPAVISAIYLRRRAVSLPERAKLIQQKLIMETIRSQYPIMTDADARNDTGHAFQSDNRIRFTYRPDALF